MTDVTTAPRTSRRLRIALIISLMLNLIVAGLVAGAVLRHGAHPPPPRGDIGFGPFTDALSRDDRAALRGAFIREAPDFRALRAAARADFDRLLVILRSEPYDAAAAETVVAAQEARLRSGAELGHKLLMERLAEMNAAERAAFADRLEYALDHPPMRGDGDWHRSGGRPGGPNAPGGPAGN